MLAKKLKCTIEEVFWITPTTLSIRFRSDRHFKFLAGQFISIQIPGTLKGSRPQKRLYSLVSAPEETKDGNMYELCVKYVPGGLGSEFLARSTKGDSFTAYAPYGDFYFHPHPTHSVCFIGTGSGVAPIRSMVMSEEFQSHRPKKAICLLGVRNENERIFTGDFKKAGMETVFAVSQPAAGFSGFRGRVTDYLKKLSNEWDLTQTDFYICGNGEMIAEVDRFLRQAGVPQQQVRREAFSSHNGQYTPRKIIPFRRPANELPEQQSRATSAIVDLTTQRRKG
jgi:ferredoxin-NADP reductase